MVPAFALLLKFGYFALESLALVLCRRSPAFVFSFFQVEPQPFGNQQLIPHPPPYKPVNNIGTKRWSRAFYLKLRAPALVCIAGVVGVPPMIIAGQARHAGRRVVAALTGNTPTDQIRVFGVTETKMIGGF